MQHDLSTQVALVTGASRGIGAAIATTLAAAGARVIGTATSESGQHAIAAMLAPYPASSAAILDVRKAEMASELVKTIEANHGSIGILVHNAGVTHDNLSMRMKDSEWDDVIDINLSAAFRLTRLTLRGMMKARQGRIIHISSVVGHTGNPGQANYCAAKAGLAGLTRSLARELASRHITVNCVAPGLIDTDMTRSLADAQKQALIDSVPLGRLGQASDVAAAVLFLASPAASYITGTTLHVNGGLYMD